MSEAKYWVCIALRNDCPAIQINGYHQGDPLTPFVAELMRASTPEKAAGRMAKAHAAFGGRGISEGDVVVVDGFFYKRIQGGDFTLITGHIPAVVLPDNHMALAQRGFAFVMEPDSEVTPNDIQVYMQLPQQVRKMFSGIAAQRTPCKPCDESEARISPQRSEPGNILLRYPREVY